MWILCGITSVAFCAVAWIMGVRKNARALWAAICSLAFVALTLLMEYRMICNWIAKEDWSALMDVVPSTFSMLTGYVIIMFLANIVPVVMLKKRK